MDFKKELNDRINYIEEIINNNLIDENSKKDDLQYQIYEAMNYSVMSGGKRLRPMLLLETSRLFGGADEDTFPFMTAIELIHTYSLVHDDLEAMDNDEYRRGKKTTHAVYGEAMGVLCGDALLNYAFEIGLDGIKKASDKNLAIDSLSILSEKAGVFGMIGGQVVDIKNDGKKIDINTLDYINELKKHFIKITQCYIEMYNRLFDSKKNKIKIYNSINPSHIFSFLKISFFCISS